MNARTLPDDSESTPTYEELQSECIRLAAEISKANAILEQLNDEEPSKFPEAVAGWELHVFRNWMKDPEFIEKYTRYLNEEGSIGLWDAISMAPSGLLAEARLGFLFGRFSRGSG